MELPLDRSALMAAVARGETFEYRLFWGHAPRADGRLGDSVFSQWWHAPFEVDGVVYATAEHWMMAAKARLFGDLDACAAVLGASRPADAKAIGRRVRGFDDARWKTRRFDAVVEGNVHKFGRDPALRAYLDATRDAILVEASPTDRIWGIGLGRDHDDARDPARWRGANLLGFALIAARERLRVGQASMAVQPEVT